MDTQKEKPEILGLDFEECYNIGKLVQFLPLNTHGHVIGNRREYIINLVKHLDKLPPHEMTPEFCEWRSRAKTAIQTLGGTV